MANAMKFGKFFKERRIVLEKTLRQFCFENELDPGNISKLERGLLPPPQSREKLEEYAKLLKIKKGSDEWYTFFDLAAAETGRIPDDLMEEKKIEDKLPIFFRTLRGQKVPNEKLDELIKKLRGS
jgi:transcriptional regulator with XRE-family HTH domain|tara:strand:- start:533 stop:907 length:375 start_codon:yes stop_codon:yes gene_type:complete